jgi:hypothetical protein
MLSMNECLLYVMNDVYFLNMISLWWIWETNATYDQLSSYQEYVLRSWSEEEIQIDIALAQALSFMNIMDCICTYRCLTGQVEGSRRTLPSTMEISIEGANCRHRTNGKGNHT